MRCIRLLPALSLAVLLLLPATGIGYANHSIIEASKEQMQIKDKSNCAVATPGLLGEVVQEVILLRQINVMGLDNDQIENLLPPLRKMLLSCKDFEKEIKDIFAREHRLAVTDQNAEDVRQKLYREAKEALSRFNDEQTGWEQEIGDILSERQLIIAQRILHAPVLYDEALSDEAKENLRRKVKEYRQKMARQESCKSIRKGGCILPPAKPGNGNNSPVPKAIRRPGFLFERSKRLEQILTLLEEKLKTAS
ncbi:MAG: hypothetical protein PHX89_01950 [bacterium]|nr:hypothetical protein [bacterium]